MKKILITGSSSYIGTSLEKWLERSPNEYLVDKISLRNENWKMASFKHYDTIVHTAALVHSKKKKKEDYFEINKNLTIEVAEKAKKEGVKQFIFLSTMGVYHIKNTFITHQTLPSPCTYYAKSKYEAEQTLKEKENVNFKVAILRPPLVYGKKSPGNYYSLVKLGLISPLFPRVNNRRSMIYIDNLTEFIKLLIQHEKSGIFFPQNREAVNVAHLVRIIKVSHNKKVKFTKVFNPIIRLVSKKSNTFKKVFESFEYDKSLPGGPENLNHSELLNYQTVSFEESVRITQR